VILVVSFVVAAAMLALFSLQVTTRSTGGSSGGGFAADYRTELESFRSATASWQSKGQALKNGSATAVLPVYVGIRGATDDAAKRFAALKAPGRAAADYDTLVRLLHAQSAALGDVITYARANQPKQLSFALQRYASLVSDWLTTRQKVDRDLAAS
jgi:hypothetical protein